MFTIRAYDVQTLRCITHGTTDRVATPLLEFPHERQAVTACSVGSRSRQTQNAAGCIDTRPCKSADTAAAAAAAATVGGGGSDRGGLRTV